jgi:hypothetical protein
MRMVLSATAALRALALGVVAALTFGVAGQAAFAEGRLAAKSFDGVWRITKVVTTASTDSHPQPSLEIFYRGYFSIIRDNSSEPRTPSAAPEDPTRLTDTEKVARYDEWAPFGASAGTYEVKGDTIITHNLVAKQVRGVGITEEATVKFEGADTFVATARSEPGVPAGRETTYTRVR